MKKLNEEHMLVMACILCFISGITFIASGATLHDAIKIKNMQEQPKCYIIDNEFAKNVNIVEDAILRSEPSKGGIINPYRKIEEGIDYIKALHNNYYNISNDTMEDKYHLFKLSKQQYEEMYNVCILPSGIEPIRIVSNEDFLKYPMSIHPSLK